MKLKSMLEVLIGTIVLASSVSLGAIAQTPPIDDAGASQTGENSQTSQPTAEEPTTFRCISQNGTPPGIIAQKGTMQTPPMIVFKTNYFGDKFTPQQRCNNIAKRFTSAVAQNNGSLSDLFLTHGRLKKSYEVICWTQSQSGSCDDSNILFTLKPSNKDRAAHIIGQLQDFAAGNADVPPVEEGSTPIYAPLQKMVNSHLTVKAPRRSGRF